MTYHMSHVLVYPVWSELGRSSTSSSEGSGGVSWGWRRSRVIDRYSGFLGEGCWTGRGSDGGIDPTRHTPTSPVVQKHRYLRSNFLTFKNVALDEGATGGIDPNKQTSPMSHQKFCKRERCSFGSDAELFSSLPSVAGLT